MKKQFFYLILAISIISSSCKKDNAAASIQTIKIGGLFSLTGNWSSLGIPSQEAMKLALIDINQDLEEKGSNIRFSTVVYDTELDTTIAKNSITRAFTSNNVKYIIGPQSSAEVAAILPYANANNIKQEKMHNERVYNYKGAVYCISVSTEVFMVRRNGKSVWTGNSRGSNGPIVMLTRQPSEGRARSGGLRLGEMERDCFIAHGTSNFLAERMLHVSDNYRVFICKKCGMHANVNTDKSIYSCKYCKNNTDIAQVRMPYAFKLLNQELYTMNIMMRYVCN